MKTSGHQTGNNEPENQKQLKANQKEYILMLEKIMFFISHEIRQQVAHIQGLSNLMNTNNKPYRLNKNLIYIKKSALLLDVRTRTLSALIYKKILSLKSEEEARTIQKPIIR